MSEKKRPSGWPKGVSGNPNGRTRGLERIFQEELRAVREAFITAKANGEPDAEEILDGYRAVFRRLWTIAMKGEDKDSLVALKIVLERAHGLPKQTVALVDDTDPQAEANWAAVPVEKRRELFETLALIAPDGDGADTTEH